MTFFSWIAFSPFHALFTIYYHILGSPTSEDCAADVQRLDKLGVITAQASKTRFEYITVSRAIASLNRITRCVFEVRRSKSPHWTATPEYQAAFAGWPVTPNAQDQSPYQEAQTNARLILDIDDLVQILPSFEGTQFTSTDDFRNVISHERFEPISYMQEVESQFVRGSANYGSWWNIDLLPT